MLKKNNLLQLTAIFALAIVLFSTTAFKKSSKKETEITYTILAWTLYVPDANTYYALECDFISYDDYQANTDAYKKAFAVKANELLRQKGISLGSAFPFKEIPDYQVQVCQKYGAINSDLKVVKTAMDEYNAEFKQNNDKQNRLTQIFQIGKITINK